MSNFIDSLNKISDRQGKERINPMVIEGFGPGFVPPPPLPEAAKIMSAAELHGEALELPEDDVVMPPPNVTDSPLLKLGLTAQQVVALEKEADLWVRDGSAGYRGRSVGLSEADQATIAKVVLKALRRDLDSLYSERIGTKPRAPRKATVKRVSRNRPPAAS